MATIASIKYSTLKKVRRELLDDVADQERFEQLLEDSFARAEMFLRTKLQQFRDTGRILPRRLARIEALLDSASSKSPVRL